MEDLTKTLKNVMLRGMEAIGNTASNIASNTKFKVNEMNLVNRRREILADFGQKSYELWQKGESFPAELNAQLIELSKVDEALSILRADHVAGASGVVTDTEDGDEPVPDDQVVNAENNPAEEET